MHQILITLNLSDGTIGEKPIELSPDLFHKAALLRDKDSGLAYVDSLFKSHAKYAITSFHRMFMTSISLIKL